MEKDREKKEKEKKRINIKILLTWQPVKVVEWGLESVGVRVEPTTQVMNGNSAIIVTPAAQGNLHEKSILVT
jgi:hypothetical protein